MIPIEHLAHIGIRVAEFARSAAFYRQFGFEVTREDLQEHVVVLRHASGLELNLLDSANDANRGRNVLMDVTPRYPGLTHLALRVEDVEGARVRLESAGIHITEGPVTFGDGSTSIFFRDPDRNVIELTEYPADDEPPAATGPVSGVGEA
jgi:catechol 2,3-dioxygenase-like lactoylglutathione lyase family enzyme